MEAAVAAAWDGAVDAMVAAALTFALAPAIPLLALVAVLMMAGRRAWLRMLQRRHPSLTFEPRTRLAAAMDTARNQGTATALLVLRGHLRATDLQPLLQIRLLGGRARRHLRLALDWRLGRYGWREPDAPFDLTRHVLDAPTMWRGRPADTFTIQECVNAQAGRLLPVGHPPWQVALMVAEDRTYVLVRVHLALMAADKLSLSDFVPLDAVPADLPAELQVQEQVQSVTPPLLGEDDELPPPASQQIPPVTNTNNSKENNSEKWEGKEYDPPLVPPASPPFVALSALYKNFKAFTLSVAQEIKALDPAKEGTPPEGPVTWTVALMVALTQITLRAPGDPRGLRAQFIWGAPGEVLNGVMYALSPTVVLRTAVAAVWRLGVWAGAVAPLLALREAALLAAGRGGESTTGAVAAALFLLAAAAREVWRAVSAAVQAPRCTLLELKSVWAEPLSELQAASLCGRKAVAWSAPVPAATVQRARASCGGAQLSVDEVATAALARALDAYFLLAALPQPGAVPATVRAQTLREAMGPRPHRARAWTCLALPTGAAGDGWDSACAAAVEAARAARARAAGLRAATAAAQTAAAALLPSVALRCAVNALTRRYAVAITFLREDEQMQNKNVRKQLAGCDLEDSFVWRPPQANISLSLAVIRGTRGLQLGALSDAQLTPAPAFLAVAFERELRRAAGETDLDSPAPAAATHQDDS